MTSGTTTDSATNIPWPQTPYGTYGPVVSPLGGQITIKSTPQPVDTRPICEHVWEQQADSNGFLILTHEGYADEFILSPYDDPREQERLLRVLARRAHRAQMSPEEREHDAWTEALEAL